MEIGPAPKDKNGLVLRPKLRDCIGKSCPCGSCVSTQHHLYWPRSMYAEHSDLAFAFRSDRHNIIGMAQCRHNSNWPKAIHNRYNCASVPSMNVMATFLDESEILSACGVTASKMEFIVRAVLKRQRRERPVSSSMLENLQLNQERLLELGSAVGRFEILPETTVQEVLLPQIVRLRQIAPEVDLGTVAVLAA